jgi:hypothetical protein
VDLPSVETIGLIIAGLALVVAALSAWISLVNERKRTQPIVVAHEDHPRRFSPDPQTSAWVVDSHLTNEGGGPSFNVRFGVEFHGVRYPYRLRDTDPESGNVQRVIRPGERRPQPDGSWPILVDSGALWTSAEKGDPDPGRVYWSRYENAQGKVWETRNPGDRSARLDIRRVWLPLLAEGWEGWKRKRARKHGAEWEARALEELRAGMTAEPPD